MDNFREKEPLDYYQKLYNMFGSVNPVIDEKTKELRKLGTLCGAGIIGFIVLQYLVIFFLNFFNLYDNYKTDLIFQHGVGAIAPVLYVFVPFLILYLIYNPVEREEIIAYNKPRNTEMFVLAIFAGLMVCFAGDTITSVFSGFISVFGVNFTSPQVELPDGLIGKALIIVEFAIVPALVEEFALRGVILTPLRKYGDWFAIVITSLIFAMMHGNMVQIPFAFIAGIALGYFRIATNSLWTPIAIHSLNNLFSAVFAFLYDGKTNVSYVPYMTIMAAVMIVGIFALILFVKNNDNKMKKDTSALEMPLKTAAYLCTPTVVIAIALSIFTTISYSKITTGFGVIVLLVMISIIAFFIFRGISVMRKDARITHNSVYTASFVIEIAAVIVEVYLVVIAAASASAIK